MNIGLVIESTIEGPEKIIRKIWGSYTPPSTIKVRLRLLMTGWQFGCTTGIKQTLLVKSGFVRNRGGRSLDLCCFHISGCTASTITDMNWGRRGHFLQSRLSLRWWQSIILSGHRNRSKWVSFSASQHANFRRISCKKTYTPIFPTWWHGMLQTDRNGSWTWKHTFLLWISMLLLTH